MRMLVPFVALSTACGPAASLDLDLSQSELVPTVFTATLDGEASGLEDAWVEFGLDDAFDQVAPLDVDAALPWSVPLLGMKSGSAYQARIAVQVDGEVHTGRGHDITTGSVPAEFPDWTLDRREGEAMDSLMVAGIVGNANAAVVLDTDGDYVWWVEPEGVDQVGRTIPSRDGSSLLMVDLNANAMEAGSMVRVSLDGTDNETISLPNAHHELYEHEDGTIAYLANDPAVVGGEEITGDSIVERAPDGTTTVIWSAWDTQDRLPYEAGGGQPGHWPHANALEYLPDEDAYLVSLLFLDTILRIDRGTGSLDWIMGGEYSDFELVGGGTDLFERTHQMHWQGDSIVVFVNGDAQGGESRIVEYAVDEDAFEVELLWDYWPDPGLSCVSLGGVQRLDSGNTLATFSYSGEIHEVTPDGEASWTMSASAGGVIGYVTPVDSLYMD